MAVGLKKRRRIQLIIVAFILVGASAALMGYAFKDKIEFFRSPSQVLAEVIAPDEVFRIGGLVEPGTLTEQGEEIRFFVTDNAARVEVRFVGILPDLFEEGQGMIATGQLRDGIFIAQEILAKHDENYMPKEIADTLKEQGLYKPAEK